MLGGRMSNQDEDEVEDELEAMERDVGRTRVMPEVPSGVKVEENMPNVPQETPEERAKRRQRERAATAQAREAIPA